MSQNALKSSFGKVFFQILAKIKMTRNKNWLFGRHFETVRYFTLLYFTLLYFTLLYFTLLYFTLLYFTLLYFTLLYFILFYLFYFILFLCWNMVVISVHILGVEIKNFQWDNGFLR